eukprot:CAMPEP_0202874212 /NCGR_PEP_ID=MMETSP1391-20130828/24970_1 /ASSEMBLY_ACC=CAM_ASM_000867 /TAXON_ID=1034604 /ORGANISM="Chlamydomonas leiostraca, Strain SAG 11-49" /LENGTH=63 /DNA_ID=CAMNT_0049555605 /DNA_START=1883 /DNA_END=2074 /DNA_ORIENTATION=-
MSTEYHIYYAEKDVNGKVSATPRPYNNEVVHTSDEASKRVRELNDSSAAKDNVFSYKTIPCAR